MTEKERKKLIEAMAKSQFPIEETDWYHLSEEERKEAKLVAEKYLTVAEKFFNIKIDESYNDGYTQGYDIGYYAGADFYDR